MADKNTPGSNSQIRAGQRRSMGAATRKRSQSNDLGTCQDPAIQHQGFVPVPSENPIHRRKLGVMAKRSKVGVCVMSSDLCP